MTTSAFTIPAPPHRTCFGAHLSPCEGSYTWSAAREDTPGDYVCACDRHLAHAIRRSGTPAIVILDIVEEKTRPG